MIEAQAPGKLLLAGEYAVLNGAPAVAVALDVRAHARISESATSVLRTEQADYPFELDSGNRLRWTGEHPAERGALLDALLTELQFSGRAVQPIPVQISLDSSAFSQVDANGEVRKFGLGSSAAVLVALGGALLRAWGLDLPKAALAELCCAAHRRFQQGRGSGVDVLTAVHGGLIVAYPGSGDVAVEAPGWPAGLHLVIAWSGRSASTPALIDRFDQFRASQPDSDCLQALDRAARHAAEAWRAADSAGILAATHGYATALENLDRATGIGILTTEHRHLGELADQAGAIYKTSGAGGGDLGFALTDRATIARAARDSFAAAGYRLLEVACAAPGLEVVSGP
ncbi:MAG: hypothetical protein QNJ73_02240 [Gammaproteobacteria bacterium]|nr:hypothetical protein [Gammaproteobacteria bacterium]